MGNAGSQSRFGKESTAADVVKGLDLRGKVAVITGVTSHIALEAAKALMDQGATVVGGSSNMAAGGRLEQMFERKYGTAEHSASCDHQQKRSTDGEGEGEIAESENLTGDTDVDDELTASDSKGEGDGERERETARGRAGTAVRVKLKERRKKGRFVCLLLDLASYESIQAFYANFLELGLPLHLLINAETVAGLEHFETAESGVERHFAVNYLGHFLLSMLLLPSLLASKPSRIVSVSSSAHSELLGKLNCFDISRLPPLPEDYSEWGNFALSKLCLILFAAEVDRKCVSPVLLLSHTFVLTITVALSVSPHSPSQSPTVFTHTLSPPPIAYSVLGVLPDSSSRFGRQGLLSCSLHPGLLTAENIKNKTENKSRSASQAAATIVYCATQAAVRGGCFYADCAPAQASSEATNKHFARLLWRLSERLLQSAGVQWQPVDNKIDIMIEDARMHAAILNSAEAEIGQEHWQPDSDTDSCLLCEVEFRTRVRKHHCRFCGSIVCQACSRLAMEPVTPPSATLLRACNSCVVARLWNEAI